MKSKVLKVLYVFYKYYDSGGTKSIAYFSAVMALIGIIVINILSILVFSDLIDYIPLYKNPRWVNYLLVSVLFIFPLCFLIMSNFKKKDVLKVKLNQSLKINYFYLVAYIILSVLLLIFVVHLDQ